MVTISSDDLILKQKPEDFVVIEVPRFEFQTDNLQNEELKKGTIALLIKRDISFYDAKRKLEKYFKFSYNGIKDKKAVTYQFIEINKLKKTINKIGEDENIEIGNPQKVENLLNFISKSKNTSQNHISFDELYVPNKQIEIIPFSFGENEIYPGNLIKNYFIINSKLGNDILEDVNLKSGTHNFNLINYFDEQRFSKNNVEVAKSILKRDYDTALEILKKDLDVKNINDLNGYKDLIKLILNSYQSYIFNKGVSSLVENSVGNVLINDKEYKIGDISEISFFPLIGYDSRRKVRKTKYEDLIYDLLEEDSINFRSFVIKELKNLSMDHSKRKIFIDTSVKVSKDCDFYRFNFFLEKGSYATMLIKQIFLKNLIN